ncbi:MAG: phosphoadenylyl-sulfate reductase [Candidatus Paceibacterota bacterium]
MTYLEKIEEAKKIIKEAIKKYPRLAVSCSFGKDSMVLLHLCVEVKKNIPVFSVMADTEFLETYNFSKKISRKWNLNYKEYSFEQTGGLDNCCGNPKVNAFKKAVDKLDAWISGVRSTEGITRSNFKTIEERNGLAKINPILNLTELDIWRYIALNKIPIHPKYKEGYRSLGCKICSTKELSETETERAGRWRNCLDKDGNHKLECGIHCNPLK